MTAFERREARGEWGGRAGRLAWELRSVNHRYLEIQPRLPEELRSLEPSIRERVRSQLGRGKVECHLRYTAEPGGAGGLEVDWERVDALARIAAEIGARLGDAAQPASTAEILRYPGVIGEPAADPEPLQEAALALLDEALTGLRQTAFPHPSDGPPSLAPPPHYAEHTAAILRERLDYSPDRIDRLAEDDVIV